MNVERIKAAVSAGLPVCWMNHAYSVLPDTGAASGFSVVYDAGGRKENRIGLTWSDGETLNGNPADFFVDYRVPAHVVDDALAEHTAESILNQECRFVAFQVGDDRVWVAVFSYLGGLIGKEEAVELAADLLREKGVLAEDGKEAHFTVV